jgi:hypothetical protein
MDSQQIQQQMSERRAAIDAKLDDLQAATIAASRRTATAFLLVASAGVLAMMLVRRRARQRSKRQRGAMRLAARAVAHG